MKVGRGRGNDVPIKYMRQRTKKEQFAPMARPYLAQTAWGIILRVLINIGTNPSRLDSLSE